MVNVKKEEEVKRQSMEKELFKNIAGYGEIKKELTEVIRWFKNRKSLKGIVPLRGVLFVGEPGVGKSLFTRELANALELKQYLFDCVSENKTKEFKDIIDEINKEGKDAIVLIDELDKLTSKDSQFSRLLMSEMDGLADNATQIMFIATCNNLEDIPEPLRRPGRFDKVITIESIDYGKDILKFYLEKYNIDTTNIDFDYLDKYVTFLTAAEIKRLVDFVYMRTNGNVTTMKIDEELQILKRGYPIDYDLRKEERKLSTCLHEAAHAIATLKHSSLYNLYYVSVANESATSGITKTVSNKNVDKTTDYYLAEIEICLAGYEYARITKKVADIGCSDDLIRARQISRCLVNTCGFYGPRYTLRKYSKYERNESDMTTFLNDIRARKILRLCSKRIRKYLRANINKVKAVGQEVLEKGIVYADRVQEIIKDINN